MNERIKELWTQGTFNVVPRAGDYSSVSAEQIEKFAELIVKECIDQISVNHDPTSDWDYEVSRGNAIAIIKEHFGV